MMAWRDQDPPATDVLLDFTVPFSGGGTPAYLEIDKLPEGLYRATVGTLFEYQELCRTGNLLECPGDLVGDVQLQAVSQTVVFETILSNRRCSG
jgi:hypothetical protein